MSFRTKRRDRDRSGRTSDGNQCQTFVSRSKRKLVSSRKVLSISEAKDPLFRRDTTRTFLIRRGVAFPLVLLFLSVYCAGLSECASQVAGSAVTGLGKPISSSSSSRSEGKASNADEGEPSPSTHHHHHHNYRHHHRTSSGKGSGHSFSSSPSSSPSMYPSNSAYGYPDYYSSDSLYEPRYYERPSREFSARSTSYPAMAAAPSSQVGFADTEFGGLALATGHGGGHHQHHHHGGHHHDAGHGHGHTTYYKTVNKLDQSSLGLLGLLGLLSLLSNVLMLLTTTARASSMMPADGGGMVNLRIKRDAVMLVKLKEREESRAHHRSVVERLSRLILPSLNIVGHAKDGRIPINCTFQEVCKTNRVLIEVFGADGGRPLGSVMSTAIAKLLSDDSNKRVHHYPHQYPHVPSFKVGQRPVPGAGGRAPFVLIEKLLTQAGLAGRNGEDCEIVYPTCEALSPATTTSDENEIRRRNRGQIQLPFLISPDRALAIILGQSQG